MNQIKAFKDFFKGCLPHVLLDPFLNTSIQINFKQLKTLKEFKKTFQKLEECNFTIQASSFAGLILLPQLPLE